MEAGGRREPGDKEGVGVSVYQGTVSVWEAEKVLDRSCRREGCLRGFHGNGKKYN